MKSANRIPIIQRLFDVPAIRRLHDFIATRVADTSNGGGTLGYDALVRQTFGTRREAEFAGLSRAEVRLRAPVPFGEAFEDVSPEATRGSVAATILGAPGIVLVVAMIVAVGICIDVQLMQSSDAAKGATNAPATTKPAGTPALAPAPLSKGITLPDLDPLSKLRPNSANQAAPRPPQPSGNASSSDAQPQQLQQLDPRK
ncbi:hypothetical protein JQ625_10580 [Bradyrhizobium diazoefficiens]|nr:hypothetical protein [Bradyrhizobium diazoefficiens]MBR0775278.1 hypothetical protein [Bradyrhizobium diazoefficiens]